MLYLTNHNLGSIEIEKKVKYFISFFKTIIIYYKFYWIYNNFINISLTNWLQIDWYIPIGSSSYNKLN